MIQIYGMIIESKAVIVVGDDRCKEVFMGNILDYLDWRGDLTFEQSPFNEVDNLILACFPILNWMVSVRYRMEILFIWRSFQENFFAEKKNEKIKAQTTFLQNIPELLRKMAKSSRYRKCRVGGFVNEILPSETKQFAAVTIDLPDGTVYISFRGTDDTIIGWKEDFNLSNGIVPSHKRALEYLEIKGRYIQSMLRIGGHSKGGNLAMYAAMQCGEEVQDKILSVYDNDGPGFPEGFFHGKDIEKILKKVTRIIPEASVIGMLLTHQKEPVIVDSTQKGIMQHDAFSWEIMGPSFIRKES